VPVHVNSLIGLTLALAGQLVETPIF
jgi:hypothetical protein